LSKFGGSWRDESPVEILPAEWMVDVIGHDVTLS